MNAKQIFKNTLDVALSEVLRKMGFQKFDNFRRILLSNGALEEDIADVPDQDLWLIPANQYDNIPTGYPVVDIFGNQTAFEGRKTCTKSDVRNGVLPIGILRPAEPEEPATECRFITGRAFIKSGKFYAAGVPVTESWQLQYAYEAYNVIEEKL